mmetsp:Transcript_34671/g.33859  ORF Transcript_34671/g.33859 Transcript_34671/m.33859 type:complete len:91 (+) Transcript_34671:162-434(+)
MPEEASLPESTDAVYSSMVEALGLDSYAQYFEDLIRAWPIYCVAIGTCFILMVGYTVFLKYCAMILAWASYLLIFAGLVFLGYFLDTYSQ